MREKYIDERYSAYFAFGLHEDGRVDVASTYIDTIVTVTKEQAAILIKDRDALLEMLYKVVQCLDEVAPNRLKAIWYT